MTHVQSITAVIEGALSEGFQRQVRVNRDARRYKILRVATPTQFGQIWNKMVNGEDFDALVDELGRIQDEWDTAQKAKEKTA